MTTPVYSTESTEPPVRKRRSGALMECGDWWHAPPGSSAGQTCAKCPWHGMQLMDRANWDEPAYPNGELVAPGAEWIQYKSPFLAARETVDHPAHYNKHPSGVECITIAEWFNFNVGNAIKYLWRAGEKGSEIEDLRKALWYVQREIERRS